MTSDIYPGRILWARFARGQNKERPAVALNTPDSNGNFVVVVCTTQCTGDTNTELELPSKLGRHPLTRLKKQTAAVLNWIEQLNLDDVSEVKGCLPASVLLELQGRLRDICPESREQK